MGSSLVSTCGSGWLPPVSGAVKRWDKKLLGTMGNAHLWALVTLMSLLTVAYYADCLGVSGWTPLGRFLASGYVHDLHRSLFLIPMFYAAAVFGYKGAMVVSSITVLTVIPRGLFVSAYPDPVVRAVIFVTVAGLASTLFGVAQDRHRRLKQERDLVFAVANNADALVVVLDMEGRIVGFNRTCEEMTGFAVEDIRGKRVWEVLTVPEEVDHVRTVFAGLKSEQTPLVYESRWMTRDGTCRLIAWSHTVLQGRVDSMQGVVATGNDITEQKRAEDKLRTANEQLLKAQTRLRERVKELDCLCNISRLAVQGCDTPLWETIERTVELIPSDWKYPETTCARICIGDREFRTPNFEFTEWKHAASIRVAGVEEGTVEVRYLEKPRLDQEPSSEQEMTLVEAVAERLGEIIQRSRAEEALQQRTRELTTLNNLSQALSHSKTLDEMLETSLGYVVQAMDSSFGCLHLTERSSGRLALAAHRGLSEDVARSVATIPASGSVLSRVVETGTVANVTNAVGDERIDVTRRWAFESYDIDAFVSVPLKSNNRILGVISLGNYGDKLFSDEEIRLLETIAGQVGVAVERAQLLEKTSQLSVTDELTGLNNRRNFYDVLESEMHRLQRYGGSSSLIMIDLDGFKGYNDRFGHMNGDAALKAFAATLRSALRKSDLAFRYGGDEFAVIMPSTRPNTAREVLERIRPEWTRTARIDDSLPGIRLGFSAGVAEFPENAETPDGLIFLADTALYHSKRQGGNRSALVSELGELSTGVLGTATLDQVYALAATVDAKDPYTYGHSKRVAVISQMIGKAVGLTQGELADLQAASLLHDIGKVGVPDSILTKSKKLTKDEWRLVKRHSREGAKIVGYIKELAGLVPMILHHHEWYDGSGYPTGLRGGAIPLGARIISIADAYDTMTTKRPYRSTVSHEEAVAELRRCCATQFDPELVEAFCRVADEAEQAARHNVRAWSMVEATHA